MLSQADQLHRGYVLLVQMVRARGVEVDAQHPLGREALLGAVQPGLQRDFKGEVALSDAVVVAFVRGDVGKPEWTALRKDLERRASEGELSASRVIVVATGAVTLGACRHSAGQVAVEVWALAHVLLDVVHHRLQPRFLLLNTADAAALLAHYGASPTQLPSIKYEDPVARYFALERGAVLQCVRESETAGKAVSYRVVL